MPPTDRLETYQPQLDLWQRALESPNGLSIRCPDPREAKALRFRLYHARRAQARLHRKIFPQEDPRHSASYYDHLVVTVNGETVRIEPTRLAPYQIEEL